jgi:hypothetical protein
MLKEELTLAMDKTPADAYVVAVTTLQGFRAGDIVVTAVASHFAIGRIAIDGTHMHIVSENSRDTALKLACDMAGTAHRVFLRKSPGRSDIQPVDCEEILH